MADNEWFSQRPIANSEIVFREEFDDWAILFDPDSGDSYGMNPVSAFIWKQLNGKSTVTEIIEELQAQCEDVPEEVNDDVREFVESLIEKGYAGYEV